MICLTKKDFMDRCPTGKLMAFDVGSKRIGIAITDENRQIIMPIDTFNRTKIIGKDLERLCSMLITKKIKGLVVGLPFSFSDEDTLQTLRIRNFVKKFVSKLIKIDLNIPVVFQDERLTSFEAEDFMSNYIDSKRIKKNVDKLSAFYILESFVLMGI